jgi:hypothetical protein
VDHHRENRAAAEAAGVGVSGAVDAVGGSDRHGNQLEVRVVAVLGVGQDLVERHPEELGLEFGDVAAHGVLMTVRRKGARGAPAAG